jgi:hypothetical protein
VKQSAVSYFADWATSALEYVKDIVEMKMHRKRKEKRKKSKLSGKNVWWTRR